MPEVTYVQADGSVESFDLTPGKSLMLGAQSNGVPGILGECGGQAMCATCHVYVEQAHLGRLHPIQEDEEEMLGTTAAERKPNSRLSCQLKVTPALDGLIVRLPPKQK